MDLIKGHWSHLWPKPEVTDTGPGPGDYNPNTFAFRPRSPTAYIEKPRPHKRSVSVDFATI